MLNPQKLQSLVEFANILNEQNDYQEILRSVSRHAVHQLNADICLILMVNPKTKETVKTVQRLETDENLTGYKDAQNLLSGWLMKNKESFLTNDIAGDIRFTQMKFDRDKITAAMGIPLCVEGSLIGTILLINQKSQQQFTAGDLNYLQNLGIISAPYLRNVQRIQSYFESPRTELTLLTKYRDQGLIGKSKKFIALLQAVEAAANSDIRVLLQGESGSGKELIARAIHKFSHRSSRPFIAIDCGAIPENLIESELFGHVKGAFTGAVIPRKGLFEEADSGTLFMDEIENLPLQMQAKLMRVLQEGEIRRLGSNRPIQVDVRIIAASSIPLRKMVDNGQFREDLYYRIYVYPIAIPSLHERKQDIVLLANYFLEKSAGKQHKKITSFHEEILDFLKTRYWPGNIRELENYIERMVAVAPAETEVLDYKVLPPELKSEYRKLQPKLGNVHVTKSLPEILSGVEEQLLRDALLRHDWNQSAVARELKVSLRAVRYKMAKLGLKRPV